MTVEESRIIAKKLIKAGKFEMRSCWNCNGAHEHLKNHELFTCFNCGRWFYKGIDVTEDEEIVEETI